MRQDFGLNRLLLCVRDDLRSDLAAALQDTDHDCLAARAAPVNLLRSLIRVHVPSLAADESFIDFDLAAQLPERAGLHREPDTVQEEPCRLLSDAQRPVSFPRTDSVLRVRD